MRNMQKSIVEWMPSFTSARISPGEAMLLAASCPEWMKMISWDERNILLKEQRRRSAAPQVIKEVFEAYPNDFKDHWVFISAGESSRSIFRVHRDVLPAFIVCQHGTMDVSIWEYPEDVYDFAVTDSDAKLIEKRCLYPGDAVIIPKGIYHYVEPSADRISVTFAGRKDGEVD